MPDQSAPLPEPLPDLIDVERRLPRPWVRVLLLAGGSLALLVGVVVWLIPVLTGAIFFYLAGLLMLGRASPRAARWINALDRKLPHKVRTALRRIARRRSDAAPPSAPPGASDDVQR